ncbi:MAG: hypothetical protein QM790_14905 [Nibricoccus sp.]
MPIGSAGRPALFPVRVCCWRWEEIQQLSAKSGFIYINAQPFCQITPFSTLERVHELIDGCKNRSVEARTVWLAGKLEEWFMVARLKRQRDLLVGKSRHLATVAGCGFVLALLVSCYLAVGVEWSLNAQLAAWGGRLLPMLGCYLLGLHLCIVGFGWWTHRALLSKRGEARFSLVLNALLLPPQAYRLRARIGAEYLCPAHPLAWMAATASRNTFALYAQQAVTDLKWPRAISQHGNASELEMAIGSWMSSQVAAQADRLLRLRGVVEAELLKPPQRDGADSCAYCPRCGTQFTKAEGRCPFGVKLVRF